MAGIDKTLETLEDVGELVVDVVDLVKRGVGIGSLGRLFEVVRVLTEVGRDAPMALPELTDVDSAEAGRIASAAYVQIKRIVVAVAS